MRKVERGVACAGCPHRAAYIACKEALGRGAGRVICGDAGCTAAGPMHPAATTCPGGEDALLERYRAAVPAGGTTEEPAVEACVHFVRDTQLAEAADDGPLGNLAAEGTVTVLAVMASSSSFLTRESLEQLAGRATALGATSVAVVDPLDTVAAANTMSEALDAPGVRAVIFASPCAQLIGRDAPAPVDIDRYACVGCHRCKQITGCPALVFAPPAYRVDADACSGCDLCCAYCRTHVIYSPRTRYTAQQRSAERYDAARG